MHFRRFTQNLEFKISIKATLTNFARCTRFGTRSLPPLTLTCGTRCTLGPTCHSQRERDRETGGDGLLPPSPGKTEELPETAGLGEQRLATAIGGLAGFAAARRVHARLRCELRWPVASWPRMQATAVAAICGRRLPAVAGRGERPREHQ
jgi:hypothetical protein